MPVCLFVENVSSHRVTRERLQSEWSDELRRAPSHDDVNRAALLAEFAGEVGRFVSSNRCGDAENHVHGHSTFWICSRIFSSSALACTISCQIPVSLAF